MCYYSRTMGRHEFRDAKDNEDLIFSRDRTGHAFVRSTTDNKAVCIKNKTTMHIENFQLDKSACLGVAMMNLAKRYIGKSISVPFVEYTPYQGYAADAVQLEGMNFHLSWLKQGTKCYVGKKRVNLEAVLGFDGSEHLDHRSIDEVPTMAHASRERVTSITRF